MNKGVAYLLAMEWSRSLTYLDDRSFHLKGKSNEDYSFQVLECGIDGTRITLPKVTLQTDYVILLIANKLGDNCVTAHYYPLMDHIAVGYIEATELVPHIIFKIRMDIETYIPSDSDDILQQREE
jgi:hypothetical protein